MPVSKKIELTKEEEKALMEELRTKVKIDKARMDKGLSPLCPKCNKPMVKRDKYSYTCPCIPGLVLGFLGK